MIGLSPDRISGKGGCRPPKLMVLFVFFSSFWPLPRSVPFLGGSAPRTRSSTMPWSSWFPSFPRTFICFQSTRQTLPCLNQVCFVLFRSILFQFNFNLAGFGCFYCRFYQSSVSTLCPYISGLVEFCCFTLVLNFFADGRHFKSAYGKGLL